MKGKMGFLAKTKFNIRQIEKEIMQHIILPASYKLARGTVDEGMVVLADCHHDSCPEELRLIKYRLKKEGIDTRCVFFDIDKLSAVEILKNMTGFMKLYRRAGTVIICSYFLPVASCRKNRKTRVINVWHGCGAMKKFGYDAADDIPKDYVGNPFKNTDIMCVSGSSCVEPFSSAVSNKETAVLPIGVSVTDVFFNRTFMEKSREKFEKLHPDAKGKTVVLWAPTFRENAAEARCFGEEYIDELIEDEKISREYYIIKSVHPNSVKHMHTKYKSDNKHKTDTEVEKTAYDEHSQSKSENDADNRYDHLRYAIGNTRQLMMCSDILITDYSSVCFEYLILDRPIIYFAPDYSDYMEKRGLYLDYDGLPGVVIKDEKSADTLKQVLKERTYQSESFNNMRKNFREAYMDGCNGDATDKLIDKIMEK
jgi:CDP-glycerol glycerophosphotransferase (TagB/SpsB family)